MNQAIIKNRIYRYGYDTQRIGIPTINNIADPRLISVDTTMKRSAPKVLSDVGERCVRVYIRKPEKKKETTILLSSATPAFPLRLYYADLTS